MNMAGLDKRLETVKIEVACDVDNPLTGKRGASHVFGPQKGATQEMVELLDHNLHHFAQIIWKDIGKDIEKVPGAGAKRWAWWRINGVSVGGVKKRC